MTFSFRRILMDALAGEGGGGDTETPKEKGPDVTTAAKNLIEKYGDALSAVRVLMGENYQYRDKLRETNAKLPPEGAVVLTGDDAKRWAAYREIGDPKEIRNRLDDGAAASLRAETLSKRERVRAACEVVPYKATVLAKLAEDDGLDIEVVEQTGKDGKAAKVAQVVAKGADGTEQRTPLEEYAKSHWSDFLPSLTAAVADQAVPTPPRAGDGPRPDATRDRDPLEVERRRRLYPTF